MRAVHGVGINDADYIVSESKDGTRKACPYYQVWKSMMYRCYSEKFKNNKAYKDCYVAKDWHSFMTFREWMKSQDWEGKHLDKDLIVFGNRMYSKDTCLFLKPTVNNFITSENRGLGKDESVPVGVYWKNRDSMYQAQCRDLGRGVKTLGYHKTKEAARQAYLSFKIGLCREVSDGDDFILGLLLNYFKNLQNEDK